MRGHIKTNLDWWLAAICIRIEPVSCDPCDGRKRKRTWANHHLIHAKSLAEAYDKAVLIGKKSQLKYEAKRGWIKYRFVGIWQIFPHLDEIADGEELLWDDYGDITARIAKRRCLSKRQVLADYQRPFGKVKRPGAK